MRLESLFLLQDTSFKSSDILLRAWSDITFLIHIEKKNVCNLGACPAVQLLLLCFGIAAFIQDNLYCEGRGLFLDLF